ncbi:MAG: Holliday junction resolvase RuvX [Oligoflexia bacterium]|nr:Holliday junction resolvase RuvX [Oligoflexia bacterium]
MGVYLGLDVGDKRVGVALCDELEILASPFDTFDRAQGRAEQEILRLIAERRVVGLVVGIPLSEDGSSNEQCLKVENFCRRLKRRLNLDIFFVDEYASSLEAEAKLARSSKQKGTRAKAAIDAAAAAIILQEFLNKRRQGQVPA